MGKPTNILALFLGMGLLSGLAFGIFWLASWKKSITQCYNIPHPTEEQGWEMLLNFEKLLLGLRKDIGHKNSRIITGDVMSILITDRLSSNNGQKKK